MVNTRAGYNSKRHFRVQIRASVSSGHGIGDEIEEGICAFSETLVFRQFLRIIICRSAPFH
jgi:hypothetical protein